VQIVLVLVVLAVLIVAGLAVVLLGALCLGGLAALSRRARVARPIFFVVIPTTVIGALASAATVGTLAVRADQNLIVLGPLAGLAGGATIGLLLGLLGAGFWWWSMHRSNRNRREPP
jgi:hypothetical protein